MATIHWLQHVPFEGLGSMEEYLTEQGHELHCIRLWAGDLLPSPKSVTALIVMGGPMSVHDEDQYPWLVQEKDFLGQLLEQQTPILGICLGAQLLANILGAEVKGNPEKEIGWFPVSRCHDVPTSLTSVMPEQMVVFHWHGETFALPEDSVCLYESEACSNQAFLYKDHVLGLQFHLETTRNTATALIDNCRSELVEAPWIMSEKEILSVDSEFAMVNYCMEQVLRQFFRL